MQAYKISVLMADALLADDECSAGGGLCSLSALQVQASMRDAQARAPEGEDGRPLFPLGDAVRPPAAGAVFLDEALPFEELLDDAGEQALEPTDDELQAALLRAEGSRAGECGLLDPCGRGEVCVTTPDKTWSQ